MSDDGRCTAPCVLEERVGADAFRRILTLLAQGRPVTTTEVAAYAGLPVGRTEALLRAEPGTDWDEQGRLTGFGITQAPTAHRLVLGGRSLYTWCAMDTLFFPVLLGLAASVASTCPATGVAIRIELTPGRLVLAEPADVVVSELYPRDPVADIRGTVCAEGHFFASPAAAADWLDAHPEGDLWPVEKAFQMAVAHYRDQPAAPSTPG